MDCCMHDDDKAYTACHVHDFAMHTEYCNWSKATSTRRLNNGADD